MDWINHEIAEALKKNTLGQEDAIAGIVPYIARYRAGLSTPFRPVANIMLMGPTGVGKTSTVQNVADYMHGDFRSMIRVDCGEYQMEHEVAKFIGAPPGYIGHRETKPVITQEAIAAIRRDSRYPAVILFDEIEKAHPAVRRILLGIMDRAVLTLGDNKIVDLSNCLIFMTSNVGAVEMARGSSGKRFGFARDVATDVDRISRRALERAFAPEFIGRLDKIITYNALTENDARKIAIKAIEDIGEFVTAKTSSRIYVFWRYGAIEKLVEQFFSKTYGARDLRRKIADMIIDEATSRIESGDIRDIEVALDEDGEINLARTYVCQE